MKKQRSVLIYNPISGHGHLDSWNAMFIGLLCKQGWHVLALTPDVTALTSRLTELDAAALSNLQILNWDAHRRNPRLKDFLRRGWRRWEVFGDRFFYRRPGSETHRDMSFRQYLRVRLCQWIVPTLFRISYFLLAQYRRRRVFSVSGDGHTDAERYMSDPKEFAIRVNAALKKTKRMPAIALNMYMDTYATRSEKWDGFAAINRLHWVGIRFVPSESAHEAWYALPAFAGMFFLDEDVCRRYQEKFPKLHFGYLPDATEIALPATSDDALVAEIRRHAAGRMIVFMGGSIGGQKNLSRWFEVIELADPTRWFFVQVGEIHRNTLTAEDCAALDRAQISPPENFFLHEGYLPDERTFNAVIATSDLLFAVYRDFRISSSMPGKAAHFRKPLIVSDRYLMGERVRQYGIGAAVAEDDAAAMLTAMETIVAQPLPQDNFDRYCHHFSKEALAERLQAMLFQCLRKGVL